ncbi:nucleoside hydrolase [Collinsella sp. AGMB00827]|uniref:Nucleoside hydrolase n=1 Tax=Collinsella ureilytica TaxID=2869515 RepID=A0ABS7MK55_9ACTN|nr:nucleoside hydrolase [Collinsella urealyticum]MBY4797423.1 nucleoside hydrolase [Collinsella urealyticum]
MSQTKMILDLDTGVDDALAIAYALGSPEIELIGITGTYGNVLMEQGVHNSLAILDLLGHPEVPVFRGIDHSRTTSGFEVLEISAFIHGKNGIGDVEIPPSPRTADPRSAADFIIESVHTYGKDLVYVPTGPLANLAAAIERDPSIKTKIGNVVLMGGALTVPGNVNPFTEANISQDPEAAHLVFTSGIPTVMVGLDVTLQTLLTYKETARWRDLQTAAGVFLADMTDYYIKAYETTAPHLGGCGLHDPLAVGVAVDPSLVGTHAINLMCETEGPSRGRTIGDPARLNDPKKNTEVCLTVDVNRFLHEFMSRITGLATRA